MENCIDTDVFLLQYLGSRWKILDILVSLESGHPDFCLNVLVA